MADDLAVDVVIGIARNGQQWQDVDLRNSGLTTLAPGQVTEVTGTVALPDFGAYEVRGNVIRLGSLNTNARSLVELPRTRRS